MEKITIVRHSSPTSLDQAPHGSKCIVKDNHHSDYELYVQAGKDEDHPKWDLVGVFNDKSSDFYIEQLVSMRLGE